MPSKNLHRQDIARTARQIIRQGCVLKNGANFQKRRLFMLRSAGLRVCGWQHSGIRHDRNCRVSFCRRRGASSEDFDGLKMSVIPNADPSATNQYRDTTERSSKVMAGCSFYRFLCPICGKSKPVSGRKSLGHKRGFKCADCC